MLSQRDAERIILELTHGVFCRIDNQRYRRESGVWLAMTASRTTQEGRGVREGTGTVGVSCVTGRAELAAGVLDEGVMVGVVGMVAPGPWWKSADGCRPSAVPEAEADGTAGVVGATGVLAAALWRLRGGRDMVATARWTASWCRERRRVLFWVDGVKRGNWYIPESVGAAGCLSCEQELLPGLHTWFLTVFPKISVERR